MDRKWLERCEWGENGGDKEKEQNTEALVDHDEIFVLHSEWDGNPGNVCVEDQLDLTF